MIKSGYKWSILLLIGVISLLMHWRHFHKDLISWHVWRQTQTQMTINNFYEEDFNILNPRQNNRGNGDGIFRMEFPIMQWGVAALYKVFGKHLIITRIAMFILGLFSIYGIFVLLKDVFRNEKIGLIGAWTLTFSPTFFYFTINPIPDNFALCCAIWGLVFFFKAVQTNKLTLFVTSGLFLSLSTLAKLPFIVYYVVPFVFFVIQIKKKKTNLFHLIILFIPVIFPFLWYGYSIPHWHGNGIREGILNNKVPISTLLDYLLHNLISVLPESLLNYGSVLFFLAGFYFLFRNKAYKNQYFPMIFALSAAVLFYFLFEINMIAKVHDYYLFPLYPLLFMLVGYGAYQLLQSNPKIFQYTSVIALVLLPLLAHLRLANRWNETRPGFNRDLLVYKEELRNAVPNDALCIAGNDQSTFIMFYYINKKGWSFDNSSPDMERMIRDGARYIYVDTKSMTKDLDSNYLDHLIMQKGTIQVYQLKAVK